MTKASLLVAVVDDEEPIRKALMRLMRSAGFSVDTFASGPEFLQSLDTRLPDCVVLDLHMPQMDGFNVQAHLAQKHAALPVIIFTGHDLPNARERAMAGGASAFLRKPVLDSILLGAISAATSSGQPGGSLNGEQIQDGNINPKSKNFPERSQQRTPESPNTNVLDRHGNGLPQGNQTNRK